ncbi:TetR/AcrR family transcriptional regulator [Azospirillum thermophilum]|uniref:TetR family transcriptional regulator n=1 Tax=Azospirillum thermophilum TaxID=2202148 RepID=A0A2S2CL90_9PROT|nr:TetR/AcrR family transcriptional regulator [Azospirillum thermophilum]AWK85226.1 TetR family transcriptional regulator [Azospirillum thermophilum]
MEAKTMNRESWLTAAFSALAEGGVDQVRVELLAKKLKVTKGSFYWHFRDRTDLMAALLDQWKQGRIAAIKEQTRLDGHEPAQRLHDLLALYNGANPRGLAIELAVRDWARRAPEAAAVVAEVDQERLRCVADLFIALGLPQQEASARAFLFYSFAFGQGLIAQTAVQQGIATAHAICGTVLVPEPRSPEA